MNPLSSAGERNTVHWAWPHDPSLSSADIAKIVQKGAWPWSRDLLFKFWDPLPNTSITAEDTNLKFCLRIEGKGY